MKLRLHEFTGDKGFLFLLNKHQRLCSGNDRVTCNLACYPLVIIVVMRTKLAVLTFQQAVEYVKRVFSLYMSPTVQPMTMCRLLVGLP